MDRIQAHNFVVAADDPILVTGAAGFLGSRLIESLLDLGCRNIRCFVRPSGKQERLKDMQQRHGEGLRLEIFHGNLLSKTDCREATRDIRVIYHLAAGTGEKSFPNAFMNSVITTRNLLDATLQHGCLRRVVGVSSFTVYTNCNKTHGALLDETCPTEKHPEQRGEAYCFAKVKQEEMLMEYADRFHMPLVIVRPGYVFGPGKKAISGRIGIDTFGFFLHLGGSNRIPLTYVDNCADAIALAGLQDGVDGEIFNIVDDNLPSSRQFLRQYKSRVRRFRSIYIPHAISYSLCYLWEKYSAWSEGQLPPTFNRKDWFASWKSTVYSNQKLKRLLGWTPRVSMAEGLNRYFEACKNGAPHA